MRARRLSTLCARPLSYATSDGHFYRNSILALYTRTAPTKVTLRQLITFARNMNEAKLLRSANYVRTELPVRLAHRITDFQNLPSIVGSNPHISFVYDLYWQAFDWFRRVPVIESLADNVEFCKLLSAALGQHLTVIPRLAQGFMECERLLEPEVVDTFMNEMLRSRIGRRVLAQQHLHLSSSLMHSSATRQKSLSPTSSAATVSGGVNGSDTSAVDLTDVITRRSARYKDKQSQSISTVNPFDALSTLPPLTSEPPEYYGIVCANTSAYDTLRKAILVSSTLIRNTYGIDAPAVHIEGHTRACFTYIPDHIEYMLLESLKNSMKATVDHCNRDSLKIEQAPVTVTICESSDDVVFRVSDQGGGIPSASQQQLFSFAHREKRCLPRKLLSSIRLPDTTRQKSIIINTDTTTAQEILRQEQEQDDVTNTTVYQNLSQLIFMAGTIHEQQVDYLTNDNVKPSPLPPPSETNSTTSNPTSSLSEIVIPTPDLPRTLQSFYGPAIALPPPTSYPRPMTSTSAYGNRNGVKEDNTTMPTIFSTHLSLSSLPIKPLVHLGLGSAMCKVYVEFWGGSIDLFSMDGYGTDLYIRVGKRGLQTENFGGIKVDAH